MEEALQYLRKYLADPRIITGLADGDALAADLPEWWREVLRVRGDERIRRTMLAWELVRPQLPSVVSFLAAHLSGVNLLTDATSVRLLYQLQQGGRTMYYAGGNPKSKSMSPQVSAVWGRLPADFRRFYDALHNGWYYLASASLGPSPTEDFFILDELEWGILDEIGDPGCNLKDLLAVYTNGMGGYVAMNIGQPGQGKDVLWWKHKPPRLNIDAWAVMDAWTEIGLNK